MRIGPARPPRVRLELLADGIHRRVTRRVLLTDGKGNWFEVPRNFVTDFASVPVAFRRLIDPARGKHVWAAIGHDYLYENHVGLGVTREFADRWFKDAMDYYGTPGWREHVAWLGVRAGGWKPWRDYETGKLKNSNDKLNDLRDLEASLWVPSS